MSHLPSKFVVVVLAAVIGAPLFSIALINHAKAAPGAQQKIRPVKYGPVVGTKKGDLVIDTNLAFEPHTKSLKLGAHTICMISELEMRGTATGACSLTQNADKTWQLEGMNDANGGARCVAKCLDLAK